MNRELLKEKLITEFSEAEFSENKQYYIMTVDAVNLDTVAEKLRYNPEFYFDYLFCVTGNDYSDYLTVTYHLESTYSKLTMVLKAKTISREKTEIPSVSHLWRTAEFHEREIFEMYGITFLNHPDLRKLLLPDDWNGYPMRKDYEDPDNIIELE
jgi:NADH-quinone oxidoreductase subunit C